MDIKECCLAVLAKGEATGYEIKKTLEESPVHHFYQAGFGSIYPALAALAKQDKVALTVEHQAKRPDRKVYQLTDAGRDALRQALGAAAVPDRVRSEFLLAMYFSDSLPEDDVERLIEQRLEWYRDRIELMQSCGHEGNTGPGFVGGFGLAVYQAAAGYLEQRLAARAAGAGKPAIAAAS